MEAITGVGLCIAGTGLQAISGMLDQKAKLESTIERQNELESLEKQIIDSVKVAKISDLKELAEKIPVTIAIQGRYFPSIKSIDTQTCGPPYVTSYDSISLFTKDAKKKVLSEVPVSSASLPNTTILEKNRSPESFEHYSVRPKGEHWGELQCLTEDISNLILPFHPTKQSEQLSKKCKGLKPGEVITVMGELATAKMENGEAWFQNTGRKGANGDALVLREPRDGKCQLVITKGSLSEIYKPKDTASLESASKGAHACAIGCIAVGVSLLLFKGIRSLIRRRQDRRGSQKRR